MSPTQVDLLKALGSGIPPIDVPSGSIHDGDPGFRTLLQSAINGDVETDLGVMIGPSVSGELSEQDQYDIARAIDRAAANGIESALILHDQRTLRVDVRTRVILESIPMNPKLVIDDIDGFATSKISSQGAKTDGSHEEGGAPLAPARVVRNASLVQSLADSTNSDA